MPHLNLLPQPFRRRQLFRTRLRQWTLTFMAASVLAGWWCWSAWANVSRQNAIVRALESQYGPNEEIDEKIAAAEQQIAQLKHQERLSGQLAHQKSVVSLLGLLGKAREAARKRVCVLSLQMSRAVDSTGSPRHTLLLQGAGVDALDVSAFSAALIDTKAFEQIDLESIEERQIGGVAFSGYQLQCRY